MTALPEQGVNLPTFRLDGQVAIVTGASSGLGERFARVLHAAGGTVMAVARRQDRLARLQSEIDDDLRFAIAVADITDDSACERVVHETLERFLQVDVLVNNAGVGRAMPAEDESPDHFRRVVDVNLNASFVMSHLAGRHMVERGRGSIVNMASIFGLVAAAPIKQASYCASKGAIVNLTRELAAQWARSGVRVNAIAPGFFHSELAAEVLADDSTYSYIRRNCPVGRSGEPGELDGVLLFLCSDASTYCTGQTIAVDGGWTAR